MADKIGVANPFIEKNQGPAVGSLEPVMSLTKGGGISGYVPDSHHYIQNALYLKRKMICVVLNTPLGFDLLPNPELIHNSLKAIMEIHSKSITGISSSLELEYAESQISGDGSMIREISNVTRAQSTPTHTVQERDGKPVAKVIDECWILNLLMDPISKRPRVLSLSNDVVDLLPDKTSMTCLYFDTDRTFRNVSEAWLITDMRPVNGTVVEGTTDISAGSETLEHSLEFNGWQMVGRHIHALAQRELDRLNDAGLPNPDLAPAIMTERSARMKSADLGYVEDAAKAADAYQEP